MRLSGNGIAAAEDSIAFIAFGTALRTSATVPAIVEPVAVFSLVASIILAVDLAPDKTTPCPVTTFSVSFAFAPNKVAIVSLPSVISVSDFCKFKIDSAIAAALVMSSPLFFSLLFLLL